MGTCGQTRASTTWPCATPAEQNDIFQTKNRSTHYIHSLHYCIGLRMSWGLRAKRIQKGATSRIAGNGWIRMWFGGADHASSRWLFIQGCASGQSPDMQAYHPCWAGIVAFSICRKLGSKCIFRFTLLQSTLSHYRKLKPAFQHVWKCTPVILRQWRSFMSTISDAQFKLTNSFHPKLQYAPPW